MTTLLFDVGGTWVRGAVLGPDGPTEVHRRPTRPTSKLLVEDLALMAADLTGSCLPVASMLVSLPGAIDAATGTVAVAGNLDVVDVRLADAVEQAVGAPCQLVNDTNAQALGVVDANTRSLLYVAVGSGIGGAFVQDGDLVTGTGFAGEIGHVQVTAPPGWATSECYCGRRSCLELFASGVAIEGRLGPRWWTAENGSDDPVLRCAAGLLADAIDTAVVLFDPEIVHVSSFLCRYPTMERVLRERIGRHGFGDRRATVGLSTDPTELAMRGLARLAG